MTQRPGLPLAFACARVGDVWARTAPISEQLRVTLGFLERLTLTPGEITPADVGPLRAAGVSGQAIADAIQG